MQCHALKIFGESWFPPEKLSADALIPTTSSFKNIKTNIFAKKYLL